jgi:hypothetical protein
MNSLISQFPRQKVSDSKKTPEWCKQCIDNASEILDFDNSSIRKSYYNKQVNYNLRIGKIDFADIEATVNVHKLDNTTFGDTFEHIGIGNNKINLLIGEELKRKEEFKVFLSSNDKEGISSKEEQIKALYLRELNQIIEKDSFSKEETEERLKKLEQYVKYDFQDLKEITANKILKREYNRQRLKTKFSQAFEDALVAGEEIMYAGVEGGEPVARKVNPLNIFTLGGGESPFVEDADIIVEYAYLSVGQVIDRYWDELKANEISMLEQGKDFMSETNGLISPSSTSFRNLSVFERFSYNELSGMYTMNGGNFNNFNSGAFNGNGEVRVVKVNWRSRRKLLKLKYLDKFGDEQYKYVSEFYDVDASIGEEIEKICWVNEWWQGTRIADEIYVDCRPIPYAGKSLVNMSKGTPNYIGTYFNTSGGYGEAQSMMDILKPLDYTYDIVWWKRKQEIATHHGNILLYNKSLVPSGWKMEQWMNYVIQKKMMPLDPTQEILKGPSQGKSAGVYNQLTAQYLSADNSSTIKMYTEMLLGLEDTMGKVSGISPQRESQVHQSETVGGVERAIMQSSHVTEKWFAHHNDFKQRFLTKFLEVCKYAYKKNPQMGQFITNDLGQVVISNYDEFLESEYDVHVSNSSKDLELYDAMKQLAHAALQNGQATFADIVSIYRGESVQEIATKLTESSKAIQEQQSKAGQEKNQADLQREQMKADLELQKLDKQLENDLTLKNKDIEGGLMIEQAKAELEILKKRIELASSNEDMSDIMIELDRKKMQLEERKQKEIERVNKVNERQKEKELAIKQKQANKPTASK